MASKSVGELSFFEQLSNHAVMVAVKHGMRASIDPEARHIVDKVTKVELTTMNDTHIFSMILTLRVWWDLGEGEFHVSERSARVEDGTLSTHEEILEQLTTFEPEEILKFAAFL